MQRVAYPKITPEQVSSIKSDLEELAIDEGAFLKYYGATTVADITSEKITLIEKAFAVKRKPKTTESTLNAAFEAMAKEIQS